MDSILWRNKYSEIIVHPDSFLSMHFLAVYLSVVWVLIMKMVLVSIELSLFRHWSVVEWQIPTILSIPNSLVVISPLPALEQKTTPFSDPKTSYHCILCSPRLYYTHEFHTAKKSDAFQYNYYTGNFFCLEYLLKNGIFLRIAK